MFKQFLKTLILGFTSGAACIAGQKMMTQYMENKEKEKQDLLKPKEDEEDTKKKKRKK